MEKEVVCLGVMSCSKFVQGSMCFGCWVNLCCSCRIPEVPTSRIHVQPVLEALEGSGKA
jgi:hypothetical protein